MTRKVFLKKIVKSFFLLLSTTLIPLLSYLYPVRVKEKPFKFFPLLKEEELPEKGLKRIDFTYEKQGRNISTYIFLVKSDNSLLALSPVCTHLGCLVKWNEGKGEFLCPCHGGRYNMEGTVIGGPPPASLNRLPIEIKEGIIHVGMKV